MTTVIAIGTAPITDADVSVQKIGVPASGNRWLLTDVLRDALAFDGFVVSDANAVRSLEVQHFARDLTDAAARAINAGLDMEMCMVDPAFARLPQAVNQGLVEEGAIDRAVRRVLTIKFRLGLFENPYTDETPALCDAEHRDAARVAASGRTRSARTRRRRWPVTSRRPGGCRSRGPATPARFR